MEYIHENAMSPPLVRASDLSLYEDRFTLEESGMEVVTCCNGVHETCLRGAMPLKIIPGVHRPFF